MFEWQFATANERAAVVERICEDISCGMSLRAACAISGRPSKNTFLRWLNEDESGELTFRDQYARARALQQDHYADETIEIADTDPDPVRARVRVDARRWVASKLHAKKYGDRLEHVGAGGKDLIPERASDPERVAQAVLLLLQSAGAKPKPIEGGKQ